MRRINSKLFEDNVFPVTSFAQIFDDDRKGGLMVFNDLSQRVFVKDSTLGFYVQRSANQQDRKGNEETLTVNEDVVVEHTMYNY